MYKLLIVDDEEYIVNSLYASLLQVEDPRVQVMRAYSASEAIGMIQDNRIDILLTDICMPVMNGMELMSRTRALWPECAVIFLTGYRNFDHAYEALQSDNVRYCLKSHTAYQTIHKLVAEQLNALDEIIRQSEMNAFNQCRVEVDHQLQSDLLHALFGGLDFINLQEELVTANCALEANRPVFLLVAQASADTKLLARSLLQLQVSDMLLKKYIAGDAAHKMTWIHGRHAVWLIQPYIKDDEGYRQLSIRIKENLDRLQEAVLENVGASVSFAVVRWELPWEALPANYASALAALSGERDMPAILLVDVSQSCETSLADKLYKLKKILRTQDMAHLIDGVESLRHALGSENDFLNMDVRLPYFSLLASIAEYREYFNSETAELKLRISALSVPEKFITWQNVFSELGGCLRELDDAFQQRRTGYHQRIVKEVQTYIEAHFDQQISLTELSDLVHFNPSYLSWLFKSITGTNIKAYITQTRMAYAQDRLLHSGDKIKSIADHAGFTTSKYFISVFHAKHGVSPLEWRQSNMSDGIPRGGSI